MTFIVIDAKLLIDTQKVVRKAADLVDTLDEADRKRRGEEADRYSSPLAKELFECHSQLWEVIQAGWGTKPTLREVVEGDEEGPVETINARATE
jgi:hypothetical protein